MLEINVSDDETNKLDTITFLNTNARSLSPKMPSLIDCFNELECTFAVITETWLKDSEKLDLQCRDLHDGAGLNVIYKNRPRNNRGISHGGVCIISRDSRARLSRFRSE